MVQIPHTLNLITELDETHPVAQRLLSLSHDQQVEMLEMMARELLIDNSINKVNEGNTYAFLKVAN